MLHNKSSFILTEKKIYAIKKLDKIKNKLLLQLGGTFNKPKFYPKYQPDHKITPGSEINGKTNIENRNIAKKNILEIIKKNEIFDNHDYIRTSIPREYLTQQQINRLDTLILADNELDFRFTEMFNFLQNSNNMNDPNIIDSLNNIYKSLYKIQVKIILKEADELTNLPPLQPFLNALDQKLKVMDDAIDILTTNLKSNGN